MSRAAGDSVYPAPRPASSHAAFASPGVLGTNKNTAIEPDVNLSHIHCTMIDPDVNLSKEFDLACRCTPLQTTGFHMPDSAGYRSHPRAHHTRPRAKILPPEEFRYLHVRREQQRSKQVYVSLNPAGLLPDQMFVNCWPDGFREKLDTYSWRPDIWPLFHS